MSEVNINVIRKNQFNHCWCVALKKEEALMVGRILYNVFRLESIKISFCDNVLNPGTRVNFRIIAHPKVKKKVEKIIIDKNPKLKAKPHLTYHSIYKTLAKEENIIDKFRNLFGS